MNLYLENGFLNFDYIASKNAWLILVLGKRQVGKTYGCLQYMLRNNIQHILLRRTTAELETIAADKKLDPYNAFLPEYHVNLFKTGKKVCRICDYSMDEEGKAQPTEQRGLAMSLAEISHIRGFNGSEFSDLILDEAIPEKGVIVRRSEGDSFTNAYTTINGNRELQGQKPLRAWLLANTNSINSPILEALNVTDEILYMRRKGKEELLTDNNVLIVQPKSTVVSEKRAETALMRQVSKTSDFYKMAMENEFAYDDSPFIKNISTKGLKPLFAYDSTIYCRETTEGFHFSRQPFTGGVHYSSNKVDRERLAMEWGIVKNFYYAGVCIFSDLRTQAIFKQLFNIN